MLKSKQGPIKEGGAVNKLNKAVGGHKLFEECRQLTHEQLVVRMALQGTIRGRLRPAQQARKVNLLLRGECLKLVAVLKERIHSFLGYNIPVINLGVIGTVFMQQRFILYEEPIECLRISLFDLCWVEESESYGSSVVCLWFQNRATFAFKPDSLVGLRIRSHSSRVSLGLNQWKACPAMIRSTLWVGNVVSSADPATLTNFPESKYSFK